MNKEQIYDEKISPLMAQIIEICKAEKISMLCTFDIPTPEHDDLACISHTPDESGNLSPRIKRCTRMAKEGREDASPLMLTAHNPDGSKVMTAIVG